MCLKGWSARNVRITSLYRLSWNRTSYFLSLPSSTECTFPTTVSLTIDAQPKVFPSKVSKPSLSAPFDKSSNQHGLRYRKTSAEKIRNGEIGYLWLSDISGATFAQLTNEGSSLTWRLCYLYYHDKRDLRIRMPSRLHEDLIYQFHSLICDKLRSAGLLKRACMPCASPLINLGDITMEPDGCWRLFEGHDFIVCLELGWSEFEPELDLDARHWIEHPGSSIALCLTVKLERNPNKITLSVYEPLRSGTNGHTSASVTHTAIITRATPHPLVEFQNHGDPPQALADIRLPEVAFTGYN